MLAGEPLREMRSHEALVVARVLAVTGEPVVPAHISTITRFMYADGWRETDVDLKTEEFINGQLDYGLSFEVSRTLWIGRAGF